MALKLVTPSVAPVSLVEAKRHLRVDYDDDDTYIETLIDTAWANLDGASGWVGRALAESTWTLTLDCFPVECDKIDIPLPPLKSVDSVEYIDPDGVTKAAVGYRVFGIGQANNGGFILPIYNGEWPDTRDDEPESVRITFTAGYASTPKPIKHAMLLMIGDWYLTREDVTYGKLMTVPRGVEALIMPYRFWK